MSGPKKYLKQSDVKLSIQGSYGAVMLFDSINFLFTCDKIQAKSVREVGYLCTLKTGTKNIKNVDFPVLGELTKKTFTNKFNEVFEVDYKFRNGFFENIFGEIDERFL